MHSKRAKTSKSALFGYKNYIFHSTKYFDDKTLKTHIFTPNIRITTKSNQLKFDNKRKSRTRVSSTQVWLLLFYAYKNLLNLLERPSGTWNGSPPNKGELERVLERASAHNRLFDAIHDIAHIIIAHIRTSRQTEADLEEILLHTIGIDIVLCIYRLLVHWLP